MSVAGILRGRLRDVEEERPERAQGPVPEHLLPAAKAPRAPAASSGQPLRDRPLGRFLTREELSPVQKVMALACEPVEAAPIRDDKVDQIASAEEPASQARDERIRKLTRANRLRTRARRRGDDVPPEPSGPKATIPKPHCPWCGETNGRSRGIRDGCRRWYCCTCGANWTVKLDLASETPSLSVLAGRTGGAPQRALEGRPDCPTCGIPAGVRGTTRTGCRIWKCRQCGWKLRGEKLDASPEARLRRLEAERDRISAEIEKLRAGGGRRGPQGLARRVREAVSRLVASGMPLHQAATFATGMLAARYGFERSVAWAHRVLEYFRRREDER